jgi:hypothetical protein
MLDEMEFGKKEQRTTTMNSLASRVDRNGGDCDGLAAITCGSYVRSLQNVVAAARAGDEIGRCPVIAATHESAGRTGHAGDVITGLDGAKYIRDPIGSMGCIAH